MYKFYYIKYSYIKIYINKFMSFQISFVNSVFIWSWITICSVDILWQSFKTNKWKNIFKNLCVCVKRKYCVDTS